MKNFKAPIAQKIIVNETMHGVKVSDPYRWLEEDDKKTAAWITKQNSYTGALINNDCCKVLVFQ